MFVDIGAHLVDVLLWLGGAPTERVTALIERDGLPVDCFVSALARLTNGVQLSCTYSAAVSGHDVNFYGNGRLMIFGDLGVIGAEWQGPNLDAVQALWVERGGERRQIEAAQPDITTAGAFVATVVDGAPNLAPPSTGVAVADFFEAVYRSEMQTASVTS